MSRGKSVEAASSSGSRQVPASSLSSPTDPILDWLKRDCPLSRILIASKLNKKVGICFVDTSLKVYHLNFVSCLRLHLAPTGAPHAIYFATGGEEELSSLSPPLPDRVLLPQTHPPR